MKVQLLNLPGTSCFGEDLQDFSFLDVLRFSHLKQTDYQTMPIENLRLLYLASHLRSHGFECETVDACIDESSFESVISYVCETKPNVVCLPNSRHIVPAWQYYADLTRLFESLEFDWNCHVTLEGFFPALHAEKLLKRFPRLDSVIQGNGEEILPRLIKNILTKKDVDEIQGLTTRNKDNSFLQSRSFGGFTFAHLPDRTFVSKVIDKGFTPVIRSGGGCAFQCTFCLFGSFSQKLAHSNVRGRREPIEVVEEMRLLSNSFGVRHLSFADELFWDGSNADKAWIDEFCRLIKLYQLEMTFSIDMRMEFCTEHLLQQLQEVGLTHIFVGIENLSDKAAEKYKKKTSFERTCQCVELLKRNEINLLPGFILFDKETTLEELDTNVRFLQGLDYYSLYRFTSKLNLYSELEVGNDIQSNSPVADYSFDCSKVNHVYDEITWFFTKAIKISRQLHLRHQNEIPAVIRKKFKSIHNHFVLQSIDGVNSNFRQSNYRRESAAAALSELCFEN